MSSVEDLETALADFQGVTVEDEGEYFNVKKKYERGPSGKQTWSKINQILKDFGGEWISNGKWSHWKVPRQQKGKAARVYSLTEKGQRYFEAIKKIRMILASLEDLEQLEKK